MVSKINKNTHGKCQWSRETALDALDAGRHEGRKREADKHKYTVHLEFRSEEKFVVGAHKATTTGALAGEERAPKIEEEK